MADMLTVPAPYLVDAHEHLDVCAWHGEQAVTRVRIGLQSKPQLSGSRLNSGNMLATTSRVAEHYQRVKVTRFTSWPVCSRCRLTRRAWMTLAILMFWGGLALFLGVLALGLMTTGPDPTLGVVGSGGFLMMLGSVLPFLPGSYPRILGARTSEDGTEVVFFHPHERFVEQLDRLAPRR